MYQEHAKKCLSLEQQMQQLTDRQTDELGRQQLTFNDKRMLNCLPFDRI